MSSVESLRDFVNERLSAAAEEIFGVFQRTIVEYEEEIHRQRRLLDAFLIPEIKLHRIGLPEKSVCKEEEALSGQQLCTQETDVSLDQEDPEPSPVKEEQEELFVCQEGEQLKLKQETDACTQTSAYDDGDQSESELISVKWLLSQDSYKVEDQGQEDRKLGLVTELVRNPEPEPNTEHQENSHSNSWYEPKTQTHLSMQTEERPMQTEEKPHLCKVCGKGFKCNSKLNLHMRTHTGERPYLCMTCNKRFGDIAGLRRHSRIHTGEKPYPCKICGKYFRHGNALKVHMRIHTGERPYLCKICGKTFCDFSSLARHSRIHTGERPFICKTCGRAFQHKSSLNTHVKTHTGEKPYICRICGCAFKQARVLMGHMKIHTC